jgi:hypothetical protein
VGAAATAHSAQRAADAAAMPPPSALHEAPPRRPTLGDMRGGELALSDSFKGLSVAGMGEGGLEGPEESLGLGLGLNSLPFTTSMPGLEPGNSAGLMPGSAAAGAAAAAPAAAGTGPAPAANPGVRRLRRSGSDHFLDSFREDLARIRSPTRGSGGNSIDDVLAGGYGH